MGTKTFLSATWWNETAVPRWQLAVGGIGGAALVCLGTIFATNSSNDHKMVADARADQIRQVVHATVQIQTSVSAFTTEFLSDGKVSTQTRIDLNKALNEQFAQVRSIKELLNKEDQKVADEYLLSLASLVKAAGDVGTGPSDRKYEDMKLFWSTLSWVTVNRNRLDERLQRDI